jgi:hypothetical protein
MFDLGDADVVFWDRVGLLVFPVDPPPRFINLTADTTPFPGLTDLPDMIAAAVQRDNGAWPDELRLAYQLVQLALSSRYADVRWILTVAAIEALIPYSKKRPDLTRILDALIALVDKKLKNFDDDARQDLKKILEDNKMKSIGSYGRTLADRLTGTYDGKQPRAFFRKSYATRSGLAHANPRNSPELTDDYLNQKFLELLRFVLDILESWTLDPGYGSDDEEPSDLPDGSTVRTHRDCRRRVRERFAWRR